MKDAIGAALNLSLPQFFPERVQCDMLQDVLRPIELGACVLNLGEVIILGYSVRGVRPGEEQPPRCP
ncbi:hypothetical protein HK404_03880 [Myxococcus xanthus]|nr:hypothetical protein [Myxococcus xanthus]